MSLREMTSDQPPALAMDTEGLAGGLPGEEQSRGSCTCVLVSCGDSGAGSPGGGRRGLPRAPDPGCACWSPGSTACWPSAGPWLQLQAAWMAPLSPGLGCRRVARQGLGVPWQMPPCGWLGQWLWRPPLLFNIPLCAQCLLHTVRTVKGPSTSSPLRRGWLRSPNRDPR